MAEWLSRYDDETKKGLKIDRSINQSWKINQAEGQ